MATRLTTWGNGVGLRLPRDIMASQGFKAGQDVELVPTPQGVLIRSAIPRFNLADLAAQMKPENQPEFIDMGTVGGESDGWA